MTTGREARPRPFPRRQGRREGALLSAGGTDGKMGGFLRAVRRTLDALYLAGGVAGAVFMVLILAVIVIQMVARWTGFGLPGGPTYAGYAMAGSSFMALAYAMNRGAHVRVSILLAGLGPRRRYAEIWCYGIGAVLAIFFARYAIRGNIWSYTLGDVSQGQDATPLWIPQLVMSAGTVLLALTMVDHFVRLLLTDHEGVEEPDVTEQEG